MASAPSERKGANGIVPERADRLVDQAAGTHARTDDVGAADDGAADPIGDTVIIGRKLDHDRADEMAAHAGGTEHVPGTGCGDSEGHLAMPNGGCITGTAGEEVVVGTGQVDWPAAIEYRSVSTVRIYSLDDLRRHENGEIVRTTLVRGD